MPQLSHQAAHREEPTLLKELLAGLQAAVASDATQHRLLQPKRGEEDSLQQALRSRPQSVQQSMPGQTALIQLPMHSEGQPVQQSVPSQAASVQQRSAGPSVQQAMGGEAQPKQQLMHCAGQPVQLTVSGEALSLQQPMCSGHVSAGQLMCTGHLSVQQPSREEDAPSQQHKNGRIPSSGQQLACTIQAPVQHSTCSLHKRSVTAAQCSQNAQLLPRRGTAASSAQQLSLTVEASDQRSSCCSQSLQPDGLVSSAQCGLTAQLLQHTATAASAHSQHTSSVAEHTQPLAGAQAASCHPRPLQMEVSGVTTRANPVAAAAPHAVLVAEALPEEASTPAADSGPTAPAIQAVTKQHVLTAEAASITAGGTPQDALSPESHLAAELSPTAGRAPVALDNPMQQRLAEPELGPTADTTLAPLPLGSLAGESSPVLMANPAAGAIAAEEDAPTLRATPAAGAVAAQDGTLPPRTSPTAGGNTAEGSMDSLPSSASGDAQAHCSGAECNVDHGLIDRVQLSPSSSPGGSDHE